MLVSKIFQYAIISMSFNFIRVKYAIAAGKKDVSLYDRICEVEDLLYGIGRPDAEYYEWVSDLR